MRRQLWRKHHSPADLRNYAGELSGSSNRDKRPDHYINDDHANVAVAFELD